MKVYVRLLLLGFLITGFVASTFAQKSPPSLTNVHAKQRAETKLVDIAYNVNDLDADTMKVMADDRYTGGGQNGTVTDIDGNVYQTIKIGDQWWMVSNLKVTRYRNGDAIQPVTGSTEWSNFSSGAYCVYNNDEKNKATYGYLYNWYAVADSRKIAPEGWHVPTDDEWKELEMYLGMSQSEAGSTGWRGANEGGKLKEAGNAHWSSGNSDATNESGFTALPGGYRYYSGSYTYIGYYAYFWSSTEYSSYPAWYRHLFCNNSNVYRSNRSKDYGFSVRCVRDK